MGSALILFAHGSRDPEWAAPFRAVQRSVAAACPHVAVELAFLEIMEPALDAAMTSLAARGHQRIVVAPLFMAQGAHLKRDLAERLRGIRKHLPTIEVEILPAAGEADTVLDAISGWLIQSMTRGNLR